MMGELLKVCDRKLFEERGNHGRRSNAMQCFIKLSFEEMISVLFECCLQFSL